MQTFLPHSKFGKSAQVLDNRRLGKQRVETWQIYQALTNSSYGWQHHPAVLMWKGYEKALLEYGLCICQEWVMRGFNDTMTERFVAEYLKYTSETIYPPWLGKRSFHKSHKSNLLRKDKKYYTKYFKDVPDNLPYEWPKLK